MCASRLLLLFFGRTGRHCTVERSFANATFTEGEEETGHLLEMLLGGLGQGQATVGLRVALES